MRAGSTFGPPHSLEERFMARTWKLLAAGLFLVLWSPNEAQAQQQPKKPALISPPSPCTTPRIGTVTPEFIVLQSNPVSITILGTCLEKAKVTLDPGIAPEDEKVTEQSDNKISLTLTLRAAGHYTICAGTPCGPDLGPTILAVSDEACAAVKSGSRRIRLASEPSSDPDTPLVASCTLRKSYADLAVIVDAPTARSCTAQNPDDPNSECLDGAAQKRHGARKNQPLNLNAGDTARIYITNKNPFRETYKFTSADQQIQDDDIGSFLSLLVPSLGGGASKASTTGGTPTADQSTQGEKQTAAFRQQINAMFPTVQMAGQVNELTGLSAKASDKKQTGNFFADATRAQELSNQLFSEQQDVHRVLNEFRGSVPVSAVANPDEIDKADKDLAKADEAQKRLVRVSDSKPKGDAANRATVIQAAGAAQDLQLHLHNSASHLGALNFLAFPVTAPPGEEADACRAAVQDRVDTLVLNYRFFAAAYNEIRSELISKQPQRREDCEELRNKASGLWELVNRENAKMLDVQIDFNLRDVTAVTGTPKAKNQPEKKAALGRAAPNPTQDSQDAAGTSPTDSLKNSACVLTALHTKVSPALSQSVSALEAVLVNPNAFVSTFQIGPYADATQVDWTLQAIVNKPALAPLAIADFNSAIDSCINPTPAAKAAAPEATQGSESAASWNGNTPTAFLRNASFQLPVRHIFAAPEPPAGGAAQSTSKTSKTQSKNPSSPSSTGDGSAPQSSPSPSSPDDSTTIIHGRRINFGSERFIVSIGMAGANLLQQGFGQAVGQPSFDTSGKPVTGQATTNVVSLTDNTSYRLSPMAFLNSRVLQPAGWTNATYATFGITAKSDNSNVRPEYMLGLSQSFLNRHFLLTAGAYIGQQTSLTGGLKVNQAVPSGLTGSLSTTSRYKPAFALAISWRVPGLSKK
jgi:hypothetical protein